MSIRAPARVLVAGIGNPDRGDDGFGAAVIARLRDQVPLRVALLEPTGDPLSLLNEWDGFYAVILVDAAAPINEPGQIHRLDLAAGPLPRSWSPSSTHAFGLGETVELGRSMGRLPQHLLLYVVEGERFDTGAPLSPTVVAAVKDVAERILAELFVFLAAH